MKVKRRIRKYDTVIHHHLGERIMFEIDVKVPKKQRMSEGEIIALKRGLNNEVVYTVRLDNALFHELIWQDRGEKIKKLI